MKEDLIRFAKICPVTNAILSLIVVSIYRMHHMMMSFNSFNEAYLEFFKLANRIPELLVAWNITTKLSITIIVLTTLFALYKANIEYWKIAGINIVGLFMSLILIMSL